MDGLARAEERGVDVLTPLHAHHGERQALWHCSHALIFIHNANLMTLPLGLQVFYTQYSTQWNYLFAALTMGIIPIIVVYLALQRQFIAGLTAGAVRG